jgi:hypothetical protein
MRYTNIESQTPNVNRVPGITFKIRLKKCKLLKVPLQGDFGGSKNNYLRIPRKLKSNDHAGME